MTLSLSLSLSLNGKKAAGYWWLHVARLKVFVSGLPVVILVIHRIMCMDTHVDVTHKGRGPKVCPCVHVM